LHSGVSDLFLLIHRFYFLTGILNGVQARDARMQTLGKSAMLNIYNAASRLESMREYTEARRLFQLVRSRDDFGFWAGAEYHLGIIEAESGNLQRARGHFQNCLKLDPEHQKAKEELQRGAAANDQEGLRDSPQPLHYHASRNPAG
jgi:TolA-binding protein